MPHTEKKQTSNELRRISMTEYLQDVKKVVREVAHGARVIVSDANGVTKLILGARRTEHPWVLDDAE